MDKQIVLATSDKIEGVNHQVLGMVQGSIVRAKDMGRAFIANLKAGTVGGEIKVYTDLLNEARSTAIARMLEQAKAWNADAIVAIRIQTCSVMNGSSEVTAYGTAVKFV